MMRYIVYLTKDLQLKRFDSVDLTLFFGHIKSNIPVIITPILKLYKYNKTFLNSYYTRPIVTGTSYLEQYRTFNISQDDLNNTAYYEIGLILDNVGEETALKMNNIMFNEGNLQPYSQPSGLLEESWIKFNNNFFALLFDKSDNYLQVIRPNYDKFTTKKLTQSKCTVLSPHIRNECLEDKPENIGLEYMNMVDQTIEILR